MKILIAVPTFESITSETYKSIWDLKTDPHRAIFDYVKGYDCARARNVIAQKAIDGKYDYVLMIDSDIIVPPEALVCMLDKPVDVCLGCYPHKNTEAGEVELFKQGRYNFDTRLKYEELSEPRIKVKGGGFGCALVKTKVFKDKIPYPWFRYVQYDSGNLLSEDLYFCNEAAKHGVAIWADTRVRCGHLIRGFQYE